MFSRECENKTIKSFVRRAGRKKKELAVDENNSENHSPSRKLFFSSINTRRRRGRSIRSESSIGKLKLNVFIIKLAEFWFNIYRFVSRSFAFTSWRKFRSRFVYADSMKAFSHSEHKYWKSLSNVLTSCKLFWFICDSCVFDFISRLSGV